ncbi:hypothetical protein [Candidatus Mycoplasma haematominutum]|uniref:hypothetical protein n=1 Tax=Candidatus Mycoplasma haematominutum TaxID=209446 RepID=UPI0002EC89CD|nr:hypothetical protein [Candidatus Mycoplasma haematominutum]
MASSINRGKVADTSGITQVATNSRDSSDSTEAVSVRKCQDSESSAAQKINFGATSLRDICWESPSISDDESELNPLFSNQWKPSNSWETLEFQNWKTSCDLGTDKWEIWSTTGDNDATREYYIGLCGTNSKNLSETLFLVQKKESQNTTISACKGNCWNLQETEHNDSKKTLQDAKEAAFQVINFYRV